MDVTVSVDVVWVDERSGSDALQGAANCPGPSIGELSGPDDVLRVEHVAKRFGGIVALRDINLHLRRGEALGLIGDNASGKSTLIKIIAGFQAPDAGRIMLRGAPVALKGVDHARLRARRWTSSASTLRRWTCRSGDYPAGSARRSPSPGACVRQRRSFCSTSQSPRWGRRSAR
jgi:energy-coupling factor transporter ATP-binding protein EcfA2